ncbi:lytic polysaccharide monooxygenase [Pseudoalteromonas denitrificans]|uniref:Chitin-binding protein n=1 Tax=Pseudoalteromonas denitrificans DSM 6059 TaxID=1123010 RepID=A0A1I1F3X4_9GAMM|nr:lytic polysaccharide monooxygenase [Pseudoalteromonas denitrificans]SFB92448.1 chitin-binding protein [Pseudoalteromonas denitrificans DSM 6059]
MFKKNINLKITFVCLAVSTVFSAISINVNAHGYLDSPKARQAICEAQQGYWWPEDGSAIPNLACRAAYLESGYVQFIQEHEFAVNTADFHNQEAVEANIPDGTLCAAGDNKKRGMNLPSFDWQRTEVIPNTNDEIKVRFRATTPHNPSFWQFYLSNSQYNAGEKALSWSDITLVQAHGNINFIKDADGKRFYEMNVAIPKNRVGEAILYTRWQRDDVVGEGFYNCSDITIIRDSVEPDAWYDVGFYLKQGQIAKVGETVWLRLFDATGKELLNQQLAVTEANVATWQSDFAQKLNLEYSQFIAIGVKNLQDEIIFDSTDILSNSVFVTNKDHSFALSIKSAPVNTPPIVHDIDNLSIDELASAQVHVHAFDDEQTDLNYSWQIPSGLTYTGSGANIEISAPEVTIDTDYAVTISVSDGFIATNKSFVVTVKNLSTDPTKPAWNSNKAYSAGDQVSFAGKVYEAKWWNKNQEPSNSNAWKLVTPTDGGTETWSAQNDYASGSVVSHKQVEYKAKWWTKGEEPGVSVVWQKL